MIYDFISDIPFFRFIDIIPDRFYLQIIFDFNSD